MKQETSPNERIWDELAKNGVLCSQPKLELTAAQAKQYINKNGFYKDDLNGKNVLCLACGGGQQSIGFSLLGANVTVVDFSSEQLEKDKLVANKVSYQPSSQTILVHCPSTIKSNYEKNKTPTGYSYFASTFGVLYNNKKREIPRNSHCAY